VEVPLLLLRCRRRSLLHLYEKFYKLILEGHPASMSINNGNFLMYQMICISRAHRSRHQIYQKIYRYIHKNNSDLLILENILLSRRHGELRILINFNPRSNKVVDKNPVFYNGNRVKKTVVNFLVKVTILIEKKRHLSNLNPFFGRIIDYKI